LVAALDHVNVVTADMERSLAFYAGGLGLTVVMDRMLDGDWFARLTGREGARARCVILDAPAGTCRIELLQFDPAAAVPAPGSHPATVGLRHLALRVDDLDARLATLAARCGITAEAVEVPRDIVTGGKRMAYLHDPDGVVVELCEYGDGGPQFHLGDRDCPQMGTAQKR
jgi:catechol 2,3-dioxygenase-like lactoylglutathione lyase family enzyme